jgi:hypothetical protein
MAESFSEENSGAEVGANCGFGNRLREHAREQQEKKIPNALISFLYPDHVITFEPQD